MNLAAGVSIGLNRIENTVKAAIDASLADGGNAVSVSVSSDVHDRVAHDGGLGVARPDASARASVHAGGAAAVGFAQNTIKNTIEAAIRNATTTRPGRTAAVIAGTGGISVTATDTASITSKFGSGALAIGVGLSDGGATHRDVGRQLRSPPTPSTTWSTRSSPVRRSSRAAASP